MTMPHVLEPNALSQRLQQVRNRIGAACGQVGRPAGEVVLLAVSKLQPVEAVRAMAELGQSAFGENYVQEGLDKIAALSALRERLSWHLIGPLQSNKTRAVAEAFDWVQSVDRLKIAQRLADQRPPSLPPLNLCLQVNTSGEASKSGVAPQDLSALAHAVVALPRVKLRGLMAIPEPTLDPAQQAAAHARLRALFESLRAEGLPLDTLSMGMSDDLEAAIAQGSTLVRVGTALFGARPAPV